MNILELHIGVNLGTQKIASNINDEFRPQEIDYFLNEAVKDYIKAQYSSIKNEDRNIQSQFALENVRTLVSTVNLSNIAVETLYPNSIRGSLPTDYLYYISSRTKIADNWYNNRKLEPKGIKDYIDTAFNSPVFREFPLLIQSDNVGALVMVIGNSQHNPASGNLADNYISFTYIKKPVKIDFQNANDEYTSLPDHTHQEIVNIASEKILNIISPRQ